MFKSEIMKMANALIEELCYGDNSNDVEFVDDVVNAIGWNMPFTEEQIREVDDGE